MLETNCVEILSTDLVILVSHTVYNLFYVGLQDLNSVTIQKLSSSRSHQHFYDAKVSLKALDCEATDNLFYNLKTSYFI